jgi:hypothetical protein
MGIIGEEMVINYVHKGPAVQTIRRSKKVFCKFCGLMIIGKCINGTVKSDPFLDAFGILEFSFAFYEIAYEVTY